MDAFWRTLIVDTAGSPPRLVDEHNSLSLSASSAKWFRATTSHAIASSSGDYQDDNSAWSS